MVWRVIRSQLHVYRPLLVKPCGVRCARLGLNALAAASTKRERPATACVRFVAAR